MNKKLESRQDILDVWVSKWAKMWDAQIKNIEIMNKEDRCSTCRWWVYVDLWEHNFWWNLHIYEILYSPDSNFFEVMPRKEIYMTVYIEHKADTRPRAITDTNYEVIKTMSMLAPDILEYLLNLLND